MTSSSIAGKKLPPAIRGGLWMAGAAAAFTLMTSLIRRTAPDVHPFEIAFFRALMSLVLMLPFAIRAGTVGLKTTNHKAFILRGFCGLAFLMTYFSGAALVPLAESQALVFTSPLWGAFLAVLFSSASGLAMRALWHCWRASPVS
jgi:drug/metabolite transporter (DMT)-like permease